MNYRPLGTTDIKVSEMGFGAWTVSTNWWGKITEEEGVNLLVKAYELGVNLFDTADTYGEGYGEEILAKALGDRRHEIIFATKFGYDIYSPFERVGHVERPQKWTPQFIRYACEQSLRRLQTDYIDLYQLHNPRIDAITNDDIFELLEKLITEGKIRHYGVAIGPDIGWFEEGEAAMKNRDILTLQIIYSLMEQQPARDFFPIAQQAKTGLLTRVPHASGLLDGTYTRDTVFESTDHRSHRPQEWLTLGLQKLETLEFLTRQISGSIGQTAIKFALSGNQVASVLPNITNQRQLQEFAATSEAEDIPPDLIDRAHELFDENFGLALVEESLETD